MKYGFISAGRSDLPSPLCVICGARLLNEAMKPSKLLCHLENKHSDIKDKPLEYFERRKREQEGQKELLRATTSTNVKALKASFLVANCTAKAKKPFSIGEELILSATIDICREILGEATSKKVGHVPLSASTVARRIGDIAEDIEMQLLERINTSPWYALQVDEYTDIDKKAMLLVYVRYVHQEEVHEDMFCVLSLPTKTTATTIQVA